MLLLLYISLHISTCYCCNNNNDDNNNHFQMNAQIKINKKKHVNSW
jgi:hypothetical protein